MTSIVQELWKTKTKHIIELFFFMRRSVNTLYNQKHTRIESLQLSGLFMNIIWPFIELRWSTFGLVYFSWLLSHAIYLKLKKKILLLKANLLFLHSKRQRFFTQDHFEWIRVVILWICSACKNSKFYFFLILRQTTWFNSQLKQTRTYVDHLRWK